MNVTAQQIKAIMPAAKQSNIDKYLPKLNEAMVKYQIGTPIRVRAFLAQLAHESDQLNAVREYSSGQAYDTGRLAERLGNTPEAEGDGQLFKGRGLIQITGRTNYEQVSKELNWNFVERPQDLELPGPACFSAAWFWHSRGLNQLADLNTDESFVKITRRINGGTNGIADRITFWERAKKAIF